MPMCILKAGFLSPSKIDTVDLNAFNIKILSLLRYRA